MQHSTVPSWGFVQRTLIHSDLDAVHGGDDYEGAGADVPTIDPTPTPDTSFTGSVDPEQYINSLPLPEPITEPPQLDPGAHVPAGPSEQDIYNTRVDIAQNYQDLASPSELQQSTRSDCFNVAAANSLNAFDPQAMQSLSSDTRNPAVMGVNTWDRAGNEQFTYTQVDPIRGGATTDDPYLQSAYNATSLLYHPGQPGGSPTDAMERYGATAEDMTPQHAALGYQAGQGAAVIGTPELRDMDPATQQQFREYGLHDSHAYQVASVLTNPADGRDYAVLRNPWLSGSPDQPGNVHPQPIPVDDLNRFFNGGTLGRFR